MSSLGTNPVGVVAIKNTNKAHPAATEPNANILCLIKNDTPFVYFFNVASYAALKAMWKR